MNLTLLDLMLNWNLHLVLVALIFSASQATLDGQNKFKNSQVSLWPARLETVKVIQKYLFLINEQLVKGRKADICLGSIQSLHHCEIVN